MAKPSHRARCSAGGGGQEQRCLDAAQPEAAPGVHTTPHLHLGGRLEAVLTHPCHASRAHLQPVGGGGRRGELERAAQRAQVVGGPVAGAVLQRRLGLRLYGTGRTQAQGARNTRIVSQGWAIIGWEEGRGCKPGAVRGSPPTLASR